jgi:2-dehydro-3-deoxygluconokinase
MKAATIGECMIEFRHRGDKHYDIAYGGDTFNTAVYLSRLGVPVDYVTALGDDAFSDGILSLCRKEGIGTDLITRLPERLPGLYIIKTDDEGERRFFYWLREAPARDLFELSSGPSVAGSLRQYDLVYLSGITLSLYSERGRAILFSGLDEARADATRVAFDSNYRPVNWPSASVAKAAFSALTSRVDIVLPTLDDEKKLYGETDSPSCAQRYLKASVNEVVVKDGNHGCFIAGPEGTQMVGVERVIEPVDTTAAGDSFNAGYLAARLFGARPDVSARAGHRIAATVIQHPGAIIPVHEMPEMDDLLPQAGQRTRT